MLQNNSLLILDKEEKEEVICSWEEISTSESSYFTMRSFQTGANQPSPQPLPQGPTTTPLPAQQLLLLSSPFTPFFPFTPFTPLFQAPQFCQTPPANPVFCGGRMSWGKLWFQSLWSSCPVQRFTGCQLHYNIISYWKYCSNNMSAIYDYSHKKKSR